MRLATLVLIGLVLALAVPAQATLCLECRKMPGYTKDIGVCSHCKQQRTGSGEHPICFACSTELKKCEDCLKPLVAIATTKPAKTQPTTRPIDPKEDGKYVEGAWEYRFTVTLRGTRSEGSTGELLYNGKPVAAGEGLNDFYQTPWGRMYWMGKRQVLYGPHGWMIKPWVARPEGKQLPDPAGAKDADPAKAKADAAKLRLWVRVIAPDRQAVANLAPLEGWIVEDLKKMEQLIVTAWSDWQALTEEFYEIHDSRHYGQLHVRLGKSKDEQTLVADFGGGAEFGVTLPKQQGARRVAHVPLQSSIARLDLYLAFKVE